MARYLFVFHSSPHEGRDDEYNDWYENLHLDEVVSVPGFLSAERFLLEQSVHGEPPRHKHLCLYEVETDDLDEAFKVMRSTDMVISDAINVESGSGIVYKPSGRKHLKSGA